jgi:uncharacterized small protein (DUF1192 family)
MTAPSPSDRLQSLREELTRQEAELADLRASMPKHSVRVHQQLALEDAEEEVRRLKAEIAALEGEGSSQD